MVMDIMISGGTGFIGRALGKALALDGHRVTILTRNTGRAERHVGESLLSVEWTGRNAGPWEQALEEADEKSR